MTSAHQPLNGLGSGHTIRSRSSSSAARALGFSITMTFLCADACGGGGPSCSRGADGPRRIVSNRLIVEQRGFLARLPDDRTVGPIHIQPIPRGTRNKLIFPVFDRRAPSGQVAAQRGIRPGESIIRRGLSPAKKGRATNRPPGPCELSVSVRRGCVRLRGPSPRSAALPRPYARPHWDRPSCSRRSSLCLPRRHDAPAPRCPTGCRTGLGCSDQASESSKCLRAQPVRLCAARADHVRARMGLR